ncbi:MAG: nuclear transport factor 2 family protein [Hellea sp.]|nr:nuclear transport factor 2 family protein [Hellea sp.]
MTLDLETIEKIKQVKYAYCRGIDTCNLAALKAIFTEDAEIDYHGGTYRFRAQGRDTILEALGGAFHEDFVACHTVHMPIITVNGDGTAKGQWRLLDYAMNLREENMVTIGAAEYYDDYVKQDGLWRIRKSAYTRIYERVFKEPEPALTAYILGGYNQHG